MRAPDLFDQAQELEERTREEAIERLRWRGEGESASACERCDAAIPEERRAALPGVRTCVDCAAGLERRLGWKGR